MESNIGDDHEARLMPKALETAYPEHITKVQQLLVGFSVGWFGRSVAGQMSIIHLPYFFAGNNSLHEELEMMKGSLSQNACAEGGVSFDPEHRAGLADRDLVKQPFSPGL